MDNYNQLAIDVAVLKEQMTVVKEQVNEIKESMDELTSILNKGRGAYAVLFVMSGVIGAVVIKVIGAVFELMK